MRALGIASAVAAMMSGIGSGHAALKEMFTPRFHAPDSDGMVNARRNGRKHRNSGAGSKRALWHNSEVGCGAKQCRKYAHHALTNNINHYFDSRMAWNERNAHVLAKREADQAEGRTLWGRP